MTVVPWIAQAVLAVLFAASGWVKVARSKARLADRYTWVEDFSAPTIRLIGVLELLGAVGLVLPAATGVAPVLTPVAATGLAVTMLLAVGLHVRRREARGVVVAGILLVLTALLAVARFSL
jgi:uncharacterized membrane protein YphA (DoxX/SURF4 family)